MGAVEIRTEITIEAPPAVVWRVLTDFEGYRNWNPMVVHAEGSATVGQLARLRFRSSLGLPLRFEVHITRAETNRELRWIGTRLGIAGDHYFQLKETAGGTHLVHGEHFSGSVARPLGGLFRAQTAVFTAFNQALKAVAERRFRVSSEPGGTTPAPR